MKRVRITENTYVPGDGEGAGMRPVFVGTVMDTDDGTAGQLVAAGRAVYDKDAKPADTTPAEGGRKKSAEG